MSGEGMRRQGRPRHVVELPHWGSFTTPCGFDYLRTKPLQTMGYWVFRLFCDIAAFIVGRLFLGLRIEGRRTLRKLKGGFITIANHVQMLDCGMVLEALAGHRVYFVSIEENFALAGLGHFVRWAGAVPLPKDLRVLREQADALAEALGQGDVVHVYPEGFLDPYHTGLNPFGSGAFHLAVKSDVPIVPFAICQRPRRGLWRILKRRPCFTLKVLSPLYPDQSLKHGKAVADLMERSYRSLGTALGA